MPISETSIPAVLARRAQQQPSDIAYTFIDYELDAAGYAESLTWSQVYQRARVVAQELSLHASPGDRAVMLAPQGLEYVVAFLGALQAGLIAVPLSVPQYGTHDERVSGVLRDCSPVAVLTTSAVVDEVLPYVGAQLGATAPSVVEIDALDLDSPPMLGESPAKHPDAAYLQYTSGSTRQPAGVVMSHRNVIANFEQMVPGYFAVSGGVPTADATLVSWLPFYHDMGLLLGLLGPIMLNRPGVFMSPMAFLQKPARWMQMLASNSAVFSAAPNFAFELAVRRTSDVDMAGHSLGGVSTLVCGAERIHSATLRRFTDRFTPFNLPASALRPSYGLAEATLFVSSSPAGRPPSTVRFDYEKLSAGYAKRCETELGSELVSHGTPTRTTVRIVDPDTLTEVPGDKIGEIWVHGENVSSGYWRNSQQTERTFGGQLVNPSPSTPQGPWLRTGDLGVLSDNELFIIGRIKDLLIVDGRNHYPDDIEATIQEISGGRVAAISVPDDCSEQLVAIVEMKKPASSDDEARSRLHSVKRKVTSAVSRSHSLQVADLVLVPPGSIPITTSGKIRRSACIERYRHDEFSRLDVTA